MRLLKSDRPACLVYCAAMVLNCEPDEIFQYLGNECNTFSNGVHIQQINDFAIKKGYAFTPIEFDPWIQDIGEPYPIFDSREGKKQQRFKDTIWDHDGIIILINHAVAWDGHLIHDPKGRIYPLDKIDDFVIREAWLLTKMI